MRALTFFLVLLPAIIFSTGFYSFAEICFFGYLDNGSNSVNEIYDDYNLNPNIGAIFAKDLNQWKEAAQALNNKKAQAIIMVSDIIFERVKTAELDCSEYGIQFRAKNEIGLVCMRTGKIGLVFSC